MRIFDAVLNQCSNLTVAIGEPSRQACRRLKSWKCPENHPILQLLTLLRPLLILAWLLALLPAGALASIPRNTFTAPPLPLASLPSANPVAVGEGSAPLTLHLDGLHEGGVLVRQNPWSAFDPGGLSLKDDALDYGSEVGEMFKGYGRFLRKTKDAFDEHVVGNVSKAICHPVETAKDIKSWAIDSADTVANMSAYVYANPADARSDALTGIIDNASRTMANVGEKWESGTAGKGEVVAEILSIPVEAAVTLEVGTGWRTAAKTTAKAFDGVASHELSGLTSKGAKDWVKGVSDVVPPKEDLLRLQEIARRAVEAGKQSVNNPVQSQRLQKIQEALKNLGGQ